MLGCWIISAHFMWESKYIFLWKCVYRRGNWWMWMLLFHGVKCLCSLCLMQISFKVSEMVHFYCSFILFCLWPQLYPCSQLLKFSWESVISCKRFLFSNNNAWLKESSEDYCHAWMICMILHYKGGVFVFVLLPVLIKKNCAKPWC